MSRAGEELETRNNAGLALAVTGGVLVATGIALLSVGAGGEGEQREAELAAAPGGLRLSF